MVTDADRTAPLDNLDYFEDPRYVPPLNGNPRDFHSIANEEVIKTFSVPVRPPSINEGRSIETVPQRFSAVRKTVESKSVNTLRRVAEPANRLRKASDLILFYE